MWCTVVLLLLLLRVGSGTPLAHTDNEARTLVLNKNSALVHPQIVGGQPVDPLEYPFFVQGLGCGGSLVHEDVVLTAAHCDDEIFADIVFVGPYVVNDASTPGVAELRQITTPLVRHPLWSGSIADGWDFMIFGIEPVTLDYLVPVVLNADPNVPAQGEDLQVIGVGMTEPDGTVQSDIVLEIENLPYYTTDQCNFRYAGLIQEDQAMMCAGSGGAGTCRGDSGGPLVTQDNVLVGVVSGGFDCGQTLPSIFARVSIGYDWITEQICQLSANPPPSCNPNAVPTTPVSRPVSTAPPTPTPTVLPTPKPSTVSPTNAPTVPPASSPTPRPSSAPVQTVSPTPLLTRQPVSPTILPSVITVQTAGPTTLSPVTTSQTAVPTPVPSVTNEETANPTPPPSPAPTPLPSVTTEQTANPTPLPSVAPQAPPSLPPVAVLVTAPPSSTAPTLPTAPCQAVSDAYTECRETNFTETQLAACQTCVGAATPSAVNFTCNLLQDQVCVALDECDCHPCVDVLESYLHCVYLVTDCNLACNRTNSSPVDSSQASEEASDSWSMMCPWLALFLAFW